MLNFETVGVFDTLDLREDLFCEEKLATVQKD